MISKEIIILISISALIAWPLIHLFTTRWIGNFYFIIHPGVFSFITGLIIALGIALTIINHHIIKVAGVKPAESQKSE